MRFMMQHDKFGIYLNRRLPGGTGARCLGGTSLRM